MSTARIIKTMPRFQSTNLLKRFIKMTEKLQRHAQALRNGKKPSEGADEIYAITITSVLSGSYNSAVQAANLYREDHPETKIHVIDSLSAGPEMELIIDKLKESIDAGLNFDEICAKINAYKEKRT